MGSLGVEVVDVEPVEVSNDSSLACGVEGGTGEFLDLLILGIVESLEAVSRWLVESYFTIISCGQDVGSPCKSLWDAAVLQLGFGLGLKVECDHGAIKMARDDRSTIWGG